MMNKITASFIAILLLVTGCLSSPQRDRAFTKEWARQIRSEQEFQARKAHIQGKKGKKAPLDDGSATSSKGSGAPGYSIGGDEGVGADIGGGGGRLKYQLRW
jgi:hypothetical protein